MKTILSLVLFLIFVNAYGGIFYSYNCDKTIGTEKIYDKFTYKIVQCGRQIPVPKPSKVQNVDTHFQNDRELKKALALLERENKINILNNGYRVSGLIVYVCSAKWREGNDQVHTEYCLGR